MSLLLSYYGDDFTGSTDVMEALASHGVETVLFTRKPTETELTAFRHCQAIGLAGTSRSQSPKWMDEHLPPIFAWLKSLDARFCHYKVCSTFDSSPATGSIGRATELGLKAFRQQMAPLIVGAPQLRRYTFGANLFAAYQSKLYRIDRHPVMAHHPVTPMTEADLRLHLAKQTALPVSCVTEDWPQSGIGLLDVHDASTQLRAGRQLLDLPPQARPFIVGSSGVEYALLAAMLEQGTVQRRSFPPLAPVPQLIVASGSVSPTTERQIRYALQHGFASVAVSALDLAARKPAALDGAIADALAILSSGGSPLIHTALGSATDEGRRLDALPDGRLHIGEGLGLILRKLLDRTGLRRAILAGGDSSSHALGQLDIFALTTRLPLAQSPGSPLCTAHADSTTLNGLELAMKGGQVGQDDYLVNLRDGIGSS